MRSVFHASIAAAFLTCVAAVPASAQADKSKAAPDPNEVICEKQKELGSRLSTKRVCMTRAQWAERRLLDRQELEKVQTNRGLRNPG